MNFSPYKETFKALFPLPQMNYVEAYNSSEGYFGLQDQIECQDLLLLVDSHVFYEFIPMSDFEELNSKIVLSLDEVELEKEYAIVISTSAGLWRYIIGDTIKFVQDRPYRFQITGRTSQFINSFGEKLLVIHAENAISRAAQCCNAKIKDYTVAPFYKSESQNGGHEWAIAFDAVPTDMKKFSHILDQSLMELNVDYEGKRRNSINMIEPKIEIIGHDVFEKWLKSKNKLGGQHKIPRLNQDRKFIEEIVELNLKSDRNSYI